MTEISEQTVAYDLLPLRFRRLGPAQDHIVVTSEAGEFAFLNDASLRNLVRNGPLEPDDAADLEAKQIISVGDPSLAVRLLAAKLRTRKSFLRGGPALHIFVVTLACDHSCSYCQVSRRLGAAEMSEATASAAVDRLFEAPARDLTVEFQGGEPLLAMERIRQIVGLIEARNAGGERNIRFTITTTLHHADADGLAFLRDHNFYISTSLDGPADLHDANRPLGTRDSHARTIAGIERARSALGFDAVSALTTLTRKSLASPEAIIDEYVRLGFKSVFLRPLAPFGFAARSAHRMDYDAAAFLAFYRRALDHILALNDRGIEIEEVYAALLLRGVNTPFPTGYVDLRSPVGAGFGTLVYNYDGDVYASDEGRMLAEMGDRSLRMGSVDDTYADLMGSEAMRLLAASGLAESLPGCSDCVYVHYCGPDPARSLSSTGDPVGHRSTSDHCARHLGLFDMLFGMLEEADPATTRAFDRWAHGRHGIADAGCA